MEDVEQLESEQLSPRRAGKRLGRIVVRERQAKGLSAQELARRIGRNQSTVTRLELAERKPNLDDVMDILEVLEATDEVQAQCIALARRARKRPWYQAPSAMPARQRTYAELESDVAEIRQYSPAFFPGLLHHRDYAQARAEAGPAFGDYDTQTVIDGRMARQQVIYRDDNPAQYIALLDEAMLRRYTAPAEVMGRQLRHLLAAAERDNVDIRVIPRTAAPAMNAFVLYLSEEPEEPTMVVIETATADIGPTDEDEVAHYERLFDWLKSAAYSAEASLEVIAAIADEFEKEGTTP